MTSRELQRLVRQWQARFPGLSDWRITARFVPLADLRRDQRDPHHNYYGQCCISPGRRAEVHVCRLREIATFDPHCNLAEVIVHELIHPLADERSVLAGDPRFESFVDLAAKQFVRSSIQEARLSPPK